MRIVALLWFLAALAVGPAAGETRPGPLPVTEVAEGVFVSVGPYELATPGNADAIANTAFIVGADSVAVIDSGGSFQAGQRLLAAIRQRTDRPVRYVINTHVHPDHLLGNAAFVGIGAEFVGHKNLPELLAARAPTYLEATRELIGEAAFAGTLAIPPTRLVKNRLELDLGGRRLELEAWPVAHTDTDLTVMDARTGTWLVGDLLFSGHVPALDGSLKGWLAVIATMKSRLATRVVPGHGPAVLPWPSGIDPEQRYLGRLAEDARRAVRDGRTIQEAARSLAESERPNWALFGDFNPRNATAAYHEAEWE